MIFLFSSGSLERDPGAGFVGHERLADGEADELRSAVEVPGVNEPVDLVELVLAHPEVDLVFPIHDYQLIANVFKVCKALIANISLCMIAMVSLLCNSRKVTA